MHIVIDWASRTFAHPILDGLTALNGTFFVFAVSLLISRFMKRTGKLLCHIGKNTLGILFFMMFQETMSDSIEQISDQHLVHGKHAYFGNTACFYVGILFFHFTFFKVLYLPFYWGGIIDKTDFYPAAYRTRETVIYHMEDLRVS